MSETPEFSAMELNELNNMGRRWQEYARARQLIMDIDNGTVTPTEGQVSWLWAIKRELEEKA